MQKRLMIMKKNLFSLLFIIISWSVMAQQHYQCGTTHADQLMYEHRLKANIAAAQNGLPENTIQYVPCFFHLVADTLKEGRGTEIMIFNVMCALNEAYLEHEIQFFLSPHPTLGWVDKTINNDSVYYFQEKTELMNEKRHPNAVDIYIVESATPDIDNQSQLAAYYSPIHDWIVCEKIFTDIDYNIMPHEMGHFLSLQHTFFGWEQCFDSNYPGWPVAPVTLPGGATTELQDGSNGTVAADKIADTPPDYAFGYCQSSCAPYAGGAKDAAGVLVNPMENNMMSFFFNCTDYDFTEGQEAVMLADLNSTSRDFLDNTFVPTATTITTPLNLLVSPPNQAVTNTLTSVDLTWNPVPGATHYLVQVDIVPTYQSDYVQTAWIDSTTHTFTGLTPDKTHYWRVRPFNQYYTCASPRQRIFKTGLSSTEDLTEVLNWSLQPNPVAEDATVTLAVTANNTFDAQVRIFDTTGRTAWTSQPLNLSSGDNRVSLPTEVLQNGIYFVALESGTNREVKRLVVVR
jgi:hypothetical protein